VLFQAASTDTVTAAFEWASSLSSQDLERATASIGDYPVAYRRALMRASSPQHRSLVWRGHIADYAETHPDLSTAVIGLLGRASALASPENLSTPDAAARAEMRRVAEQLKTLIGQEDTENLLYRLGRRDGTFVSREPVSLKLSNWVRGKFVALAGAVAADCNCNIEFGCDEVTWTCRGNTGCTPDDDWPACGWFWNETCDGQCKIVWTT
jgi:hypothetical protein